MKNADFTFTYSKSTRPYNRNTDAKKTYAITWQEKQGTITDLCTDIKNGFAFCPTFYHDGETFNMSAKKAENLKGTYFIVFDFDAVRLTAGEFYGSIMGTTLTPSIIYTTANDGTFKAGKVEKYNNRYRVIYVVDTAIKDKEVYGEIHQALKADISKAVEDPKELNTTFCKDGAEGVYKGVFNDNTDKDVSHFFAGCKDTELYCSSRVLSLADLCSRYEVTVTETVDNGIRTQYGDNHLTMIWASAYGTEIDNHVESGKRVKSSTRVDYLKKREEVLFYPSTKNDPSENADTWQEFLKDFNDPQKTFNRLTFEYSGRLPLLPTATDLTQYLTEENKGKLYIDVDENYTELIYKRVKVQKRDRDGQKVERWENAKFYDGNGRRRKIFIHALILRMITPTATREQILWSVANFITDFIDNKEDVISKYEVAKIVDGVMKKDLNEWQTLRQHFQKTFKVNKAVARAKNIAPKKAALKAQHERATDRKNEKCEKIAAVYDPTKSDKENLKALENSGLKICHSYLTKWKRKNGHSKAGKASRAERISLYFDPELTDKENLETLLANGVDISLKTFKRWKSQNGFTREKPQAPKDQNKAHESVFYDEVEQEPTEIMKAHEGANIDLLSGADIEALTANFLSGAKPQKSDNCKKDFDPWAFYCGHHLEGAKYGKNAVKDRENYLRLEKEINDSGIDYNSMTDDEFWGLIFSESAQDDDAAVKGVEIVEDEPF